MTETLTVTETPTWITVVQIFVAVGQFVVAVALGYLTWRLVQATTCYANTTAKQLRQSERARMTTLQPFLHVVGLRLSSSVGGDGSSRMYELHVQNMGPGPAIKTRGYLSHAFVRCGPRLDAFDLQAGAANECVPFTQGGFMQPQSGVRWPEGFLRLEYRDLFGRKWATVVPFAFETVFAGSTWTYDRVTVYDQREEVAEIDEFYIRQDTLAPMSRIDDDPRVGFVPGDE